VNEDLVRGHTALGGEREQRPQVMVARVHAAVGDEAQEVQLFALLAHAIERFRERRKLEELPRLDRLVDAADVLENDASRAEVHVADLAVAHDAERQANFLPARGQEGVRVATEQLVEVGCAGQDRVALRFHAVAPTVQDDEKYGFAAHVSSISPTRSVEAILGVLTTPKFEERTAMNRLVTVMSFGKQVWAGLARRASAAFYPAPLTLAPGKRLALAGALLSCTTACQGLNVFSLEDDRVLGGEAYTQIISGQSTINSGPELEMVQRLTNNLVEAARTYDPEIVGAFEWEVTLINDPGTVNAFALPGGKMAVYTGILPVSQGEGGLAVVMGHEIAHAVWRHGTQALTRQSLQTNAIELLAALAGGEGGELEELAKGVANTLITLSYGRDAELQADEKGLFYMARAGYDPREAPEFWRRMNAMGSSDTPEWLSTHPSNDRRVEELEALLGQTIPIYEEAQSSKPH